MRVVDCLTCREALSARMDGEAEPVPVEHTDLHVASCPACRSWQVRVAQAARTLRVRQAVPEPDLAAAIVDLAGPSLAARGWWARIALLAVAVAQVGLALSQMLGVGTGHGGVPTSGHVLNESVAWNLALGITFLWAAFRPRVTAGLIPLLGGFLVFLAGYSVHDLVTGAVSAARVASHSLLVIALGLLVVINRRSRGPAPHHSDVLDDAGGTVLAGFAGAEPSAPAKEAHRRTRRPLHPAGHQHAA